MGPYNITQVDVPGILGAYQGAQQMRLQQMNAQRLSQRQEAEDEREHNTRMTLAKVFAPKGGDPASSGTAPAPAGATQAGPPGQLVDPGQLPPRTDGLSINQDALRELYAYDPATAKQVQDAVYSADKRHFEQMQRNGEAMATVAWRLRQMPQEARAAELQAWAPQLQGMGLTPDMLAQADLSDAGLDRYYATGRKLSELVSEAEPKYLSVPPGGGVVDVRNPDAVRAFNAGSSPPPPPPGFHIDGGQTPAASGGFPGNPR